jgi:site-specific DNA recombinase
MKDKNGRSRLPDANDKLLVSVDDLRVAIYARVSSDQQAQDATIESQVHDLKQRVASDGYELEEEFCFLDNGFTGKTVVRPAFEQLRDVAYHGGIDRLYVHSPDRFARKYAWQVLLLEEFTRAGVDVVFLNREIGKSAEDDLLLQMQGMIAEYEHAKIVERSRRGKRHAARRGDVSVLSGAPYGYRYLSRRQTGGPAEYQVVLEEAKVVRQIFEWVARDGASLREIGRRLKQEGVKTQTGKDWWDSSTVVGMLRNPAYKGSAAFGKTRVGERLPSLKPQRGQGETPRKNYSTYGTSPDQQETIAVPRLVSDELFEAAAERLEHNRRRNRQGRRGAKHLLQGLLECQCCGYSYYGKPISRRSAKGKVRHYASYRCIGTDAYRFGGERLCDNKQVRTDLLEKAVWDDVCSLLHDPQRVSEEYQRRLDREEPSALEVQQLQGMLQKVRRAITRLIDAYEDGLITKDEFEPRIKSSKQRFAKLEAEASRLSSEQSKEDELRLAIGHLEDFSRHVRDGLETIDWTSKREIIRALVKRVEIGRDEVRVVYKVSPPPFVQGPASGASLQDCLRRDRAALRRPFHAYRYQSSLHHPRLQVPADQMQDAFVLDPTSQPRHQDVMVDPIKELLQVQIDHPAVTGRDVFACPLDRVVRAAPQPKAEALVGEPRVVPALQGLIQGLLNQSIDSRRYAQRSYATVGLRYFYLSHRRGLVRSIEQFLPDGFPAGLQVGLQFLDGDPVDSRGPLIAHHPLVCPPHVLTT